MAFSADAVVLGFSALCLTFYWAPDRFNEDKRLLVTFTSLLCGVLFFFFTFEVDPDSEKK